MLISPGRERQYALCHSALISVRVITQPCAPLRKAFAEPAARRNRTPRPRAVLTGRGEPPPPLFAPLTSRAHAGRLGGEDLDARLLDDLREREKQSEHLNPPRRRRHWMSYRVDDPSERLEAAPDGKHVLDGVRDSRKLE